MSALFLGVAEQGEQMLSFHLINTAQIALHVVASNISTGIKTQPATAFTFVTISAHGIEANDTAERNFLRADVQGASSK